MRLGSYPARNVPVETFATVRTSYKCDYDHKRIAYGMANGEHC